MSGGTSTLTLHVCGWISAKYRVLAEAQSIDRVDTIKTFAAGIGFYFNRGLRLGLRAESINRTSALRLGRYDNLRLMSSINYSLK